MPMLTLKFKKNTIADYPLQKGKSVTIGRRTNNDIVVENLAVSGHHAKIDSIGSSTSSLLLPIGSSMVTSSISVSTPSSLAIMIMKFALRKPTGRWTRRL
jgi:hypothetical protein